MVQMRYNLLPASSLAIENAVQDHSVFSKNRGHLLEHEVIEAFFTKVMSLADKQAAAVQRTHLRRWHADPGVGQPQELRPKDGSGRRRPQCRHRLEAQAAQQRDSRRAPIPMRACSARNGKAEPSFVIRDTS